jgi:hypothetical protein
MRVISCQVVEELRKKTLKGDSITYKVSIGQAGETQDLSLIEGEIFTDTDELKSVLKARVSQTIDKMVTVAINTSKKLYHTPSIAEDIDEQDVAHMPISDNSHHSNDDAELVEIEGKLVKVNMKLPENFSTG